MVLELREINVNHLSESERMRSRLGMLGKFPAPGDDYLLKSEADSAIWDKAYSDNNCPWRGKGIHPLSKRFLTEHSKGKILLEIGFGNGDDAKDLIDMGFDYHGVDISEVAVKKSLANLNGRFIQSDFFNWKQDLLCDVVYDKGMFHNLPGEEPRIEYIQKVAECLTGSGIWIVICGSADRNRVKNNHGAIFITDIVPHAEKYFEVLEIVKSNYGTLDFSSDFEAWHCVFKRR